MINFLKNYRDNVISAFPEFEFSWSLTTSVFTYTNWRLDSSNDYLYFGQPYKGKTFRISKHHHQILTNPFLKKKDDDAVFRFHHPKAPFAISVQPSKPFFLLLEKCIDNKVNHSQDTEMKEHFLAEDEKFNKPIKFQSKKPKLS